jgi:hypothetical protein
MTTLTIAWASNSTFPPGSLSHDDIRVFMRAGKGDVNGIKFIASRKYGIPAEEWIQNCKQNTTVLVDVRKLIQNPEESLRANMIETLLVT